MKTISLQLDDAILADAERITKFSGISRDQYINEAVAKYNWLQEREMLARQLEAESALCREESMMVLREFGSSAFHE